MSIILRLLNVFKETTDFSINLKHVFEIEVRNRPWNGIDQADFLQDCALFLSCRQNL